jgi:hypothetical protein
MSQVPIRTVIVPAVVVLASLCGLSMASPAQAQERPEPERCRVGAYVTALNTFDPAADTFQADLWLWSVCQNADRRPLESMEFVNGEAVETQLATSETRGAATWSTRKVRGTFRHDWDERNFPFDRHNLVIVLEEGVDDSRRFVYEADTANSMADPVLQIPGWRLAEFSLRPSLARYATTFGDPDLPPGTTSEYSRLTLDMEIARADLSGFFNLTAIVYAAFVLSLVTYVMHLESTTAVSHRLGLLAGALFATAVNLVTASTALGSAGGLTLVDKIHIVVLLYILVAAVVTVVLRVLVERGWPEAAIARLNYRVGAISAVVFFAVNAVLIAIAAQSH